MPRGGWLKSNTFAFGAALLVGVFAPSVESLQAGEPRIEFEFIKGGSELLYQGDGGDSQVIDGVEWWAKGRPSRVYRRVGMLIVTIADYDANNPLLNSLQKAVVGHAKGRQSDVVVPSGMDNLNQSRTVVVYRYELDQYVTPPPTEQESALHVDSSKDANGQLLDNASFTDFRVEIPSLMDYPPRPMTAGRAVVHYCVDERGELNPAPIIETSSGVASVDKAAVTLISHSKVLQPASVSAGPVARCKNLAVSYLLPPTQ